MAPEVSFILPVYNKADALPQFLRSLRAQKGAFSSEHIFIDDASTDHSLTVLREGTQGWKAVQIIENTRNTGPGIRLNQGAAKARGDYLALFDCDEILAPNAVSTLLNLARRHAADMVHAKWARTTQPLSEAKAAAADPDAPYRLYDKPLERVLGRGMVRMTWLVERHLFLQAGGCDEDVFIQDESLPLRLALKARKVVDSDAVVTIVPKIGNHLSANRLQQHHDRFFTYYNFFRSQPDLPATIRRRLAKKCVSAAWKAQRDGAHLPALHTLAQYLFAKVGLAPTDPSSLETLSRNLAVLPDVRRPEKT